MNWHRILPTLLFFCCMAGAAYAQQFVVSQPTPFNIRTESADILGMHNGIIYLHQYDRTRHQLLAYNQRMSLLWQRDIPLARQEELYMLMLEQQQLTALCSERIKGTEQLYTRQFSLTLESDTQRYYLDTIPTQFGRGTPEVMIASAQDRKHHAIYFLEDIIGQQDLLHCSVIDTAGRPVFQRTLVIPNHNSKIDFYDLLLGNDGRVWVINAEYRDASRDHVVRYWVHNLQEEGGNPIPLEGREDLFFNNTRFKLDNLHQTLVAAGFYAADFRQPVYAEGVFFKVLDLAADTLSVSSYQEFAPEFIARIRGMRSTRRATRLYTFIVDHLILRQDGGALLVAESYYKTYRNNMSMYDMYGIPTFNESTVTYHFDEIIVVSLHPDGQVHWKDVIVKNQSSSGDYGRYGSYATINSGSYLLFLFNEAISHRTNMMQYAIDPTGNVERGILLNARRADVYPMPQFAKQVAARTIIIPSVRKGELRLIRADY